MWVSPFVPGGKPGGVHVEIVTFDEQLACQVKKTSANPVLLNSQGSPKPIEFVAFRFVTNPEVGLRPGEGTMAFAHSPFGGPGPTSGAGRANTALTATEAETDAAPISVIGSEPDDR